MDVVEGVVAARLGRRSCRRAPSSGRRRRRPRSCSRHSRAAASTMSKAMSEAVAVDRAVVEPQHLVDLAQAQVEERQVPPVVDCEEALAASRPSLSARIQATPSARRPCISSTWATACWAQLLRGLQLHAPRGRRPRRGRRGRSPPARRPACPARRDSRACPRDQAGSTRAMRSRSMRRRPAGSRSVWPACSASTSRGCSMRDVLQDPARRRGTRRRAGWPMAATWPASRPFSGRSRRASIGRDAHGRAPRRWRRPGSLGASAHGP